MNKKAGPVVLEVMLYEIKDGMNAYLATLGPGSPMKSLADLIKFNMPAESRSIGRRSRRIIAA